MKHKVLETGIHCIINESGTVYVFTENEYNEYQHFTWWNLVRLRYGI